jgi:hypothetical protein
MSQDVASDREALVRLNLAINDAENRGDREFLAGILAPRLAFQRANEQATVDDAIAFLQKVAPGGGRSIRILEPIQVLGGRAVVQCVVIQGDREFHNLRLFVRRDGEWKLLGWANEPL